MLRIVKSKKSKEEDSKTSSAQMPTQAHKDMMGKMGGMDEMREVEQVPEEGLISKVSPEAARYLAPDARCASCVHFVDFGLKVGACEIVAGPIDPDGVCGLYTRDEEPEEVMDEDEAPDVEAAEDEGEEE